MRERPILMSAPMVRALLEGRKTQTRRVVKFKGDAPKTIFPLLGRDNTPTGEWFFSDPVYDRVGRSGNFCPYGKPGERLWVREAWQTGDKLNKFNATQIAKKCIDAGYPKAGAPVFYAADGFHRAWGDADIEDFGQWGRKRSSRFMPRWASRITLEVTEVRVQRLQEISQRDAAAEGIEGPYSFDPMLCSGPLATLKYQYLWESINGAGSWEANPWVWAVSFKVVAREVEEITR